ncbi:MAG: WD40/YVTN/BNR-like repeat-containing protein [Gemmatimonadaceae bacterium]
MSSGKHLSRSLLAALALVTLCSQVAVAQRGAPPAPRAAPVNASTDPLLRSFQWRSIGPADMGGRVDDIAVVERDPRIYYVGYATGGVWKTVNGGTTFESIFDTYRSSHVGAVAVAQSNPDVVWVGTGEANNRNSSSYGDGIYKSTDAGKTFTDMGLRGTQSIHRIAIHPRNADVVFVAATGALYGPSPERGVYRTTDGGRTWSRVLYVDENTGANNIVIDQSNPNTMFASMYERRRTAWGYNGGGPGSGIWKSTDGGSNWTRLKGNGLPTGQMGRVAIDISRSNSNVVYAQIEVLREEDRLAGAASTRERSAQRNAVVGDNVGGVWRSNDKGRTWEFRSNHNVRPGYFSKIRVDPKSSEVLYTAGRSLYQSEDGGRTFRVITGPGHGDYHAIWVDPNDSDHLMVGNDGGFDASRDRGRSFEAMRPNAAGQFYQVSVDMRRPYFVCGGLQDNSSWCGPSAVGARFISAYDWYNVGSGDGGYTAVDPTDHNIVYAEGQRGAIRRLDLSVSDVWSIQPRVATAQRASNVVPKPEATETFRWNWATPFILSPHNPSTIYLGGNRLFRSVDRGDTWTMGPDLTRQIDRDTLEILGAKGRLPDCHGDGKLAKDEACIHSKNDGTWFFSTITSVAESPLVPGVLWVGTDDGNVQVSHGGLSNWTNVTANVSGSPRNCWISRVEASHADAASAYLAIDCHRSNDMRPYVYVTRDYGKSWTSISSGLPDFGCVNVIKEDPKNPSALYVGTENGFHVSLDGGKSWKRFMTGLAPVRVDDVVIHPRDGDLVLATHGRSVMIMDDITPLQQLKGDVLARDVHFFAPRNAWLLRNEQRLTRAQPGSKQFRGTNPDPGVAFQYYLKQRAQGEVKLTVREVVSGKVVRSLNGSVEPGINRVQWNLMGEAPARVAAAADMEDEPPPPTPRLAPGAYRVTLSVNGVEHSHNFLVEDIMAPRRAQWPPG